MSDPHGHRSGAATALAGMLGAALIAGLMVTVGVAPAIAMTGLGAKNGIGLFENLPADAKISALQQKTEIYANYKGEPKQIAAFYNQNREVVTWDQIPQTVKDATIAGEDSRFYDHGAVDPMGIVRAVVANIAHKDSQGASTITQQYIKNVCVQQAELKTTDKAVEDAYYACTQPDLARKIKEARLAISLEKQYKKNDILLGYLNIAGFGGQIYGIETAAEYYYGVHAKDLTPAQAASLLAIVNEPSAYRIDEKENIAADTDRRNYILASEQKLGMLSQADYEKAIASKVTPHITPTKAGCAQAGAAAFFCDYVVHTIENSSMFGADPAARAQNLQSAGWKIYTTLDLSLEKKAQTTLSDYVPKKSPTGNLAGAAVSVQVGTGRVLSMVQSKTYDETDSKATQGSGYTATSLNYNTDKNSGGSSGFQPGSTYKLFTLLDWLKQGHGVYEQVDGTQRTVPFSSFTACKSPVGGGSYTFGNDEGAAENGYNTVYRATQQSINGSFVSMAQKLDLCDIRSTAEAFGVHRADGTDLQDNVSSILGTNEVAPLTMATAYAGVADQGTTCTPIAIDRMTTSTGTAVPVPARSCKSSIDKQVAIAAGYTLHGVLTGGTAASDTGALGGAFGMAKTGTTDDAEATWEVGGTTKTTTAVWVGNVSGSTNLRQVYSFPGCDGSGGQAAIVRHCIWSGIVAANEAKYPGATSWPQPESQYLVGQQTAIPNVVGQSVADAKAALKAAGFRVKVGKPITSDQQQGLVAATDPAAGTSESAGTLIKLSPSAGQAVQTNPTPGQGGTGTVPDVMGRSLDAARQLLAAQGFAAVTVAYVQQAPQPGQAACAVVGQNPPATSASPTSTQIQLTVNGIPQTCP